MPSQTSSEVETKLAKVRIYIAERGLAGVYLNRRENFAWLTGGKDAHVVNATDFAFSSLLVTPERHCVVTTNIEAARLFDEELSRDAWEDCHFDWHQPSSEATLVRDIVGPGRLAADVAFPGAEPLEPDFDRLRYTLLPEEIERYRVLGHATSTALDQACREIQPGQTEHEIAAILGAKTIAQGIEPAARLVAVDERVFRYRHPIPTETRLKEHALLVILGQKWGLNIAVSRLVHFGPLPAELQRKHRAVCAVDAVFLGNTVVGIDYREILQRGMDAYAANGYPGEWQFHTQGGVAGYRGREFVVTPETTERVQDSQPVAWNPTISGTKSEDTVIVTEQGWEVLSEMPDWPMIEVAYEGRVIRRPDILIR